MRLAQISITNYRSFNGNSSPQTVTFPKTDKPIAIIGHNNSGKSNLINAILVSLAYNNDWYKLDEFQFHNREINKDITIKTTFDSSFEIPTIYPGDNSNKQCWGTLFESKYEHGRSNSHLRCIGESDKLIVKQEKMKERSLPVSFVSHRDKLNLVYVDFHELDKHFYLNGPGLLGRLFQKIKDDFYDSENKIKDKEGNEHVRKELFETLASKLKEVLSTDMLRDFTEQLSGELNESLNFDKDAVDFEFKIAAARELYTRAQLYVSDSKGKVSLPLNSLGSGLKAMVAVAMISLLATDGREETVFIFEEPETYLHELYQDYLYESLCELAKTNQVILTTHSKKFVDIFSPETIIKLHNPEFTYSEIVQLKTEIDLPKEDMANLKLDKISDFSYFLRSIEPNMGLFLFSKRAIFVEGPHDVLAYRLALKDISLSSKNISLTASWGKDTSKYLSKLCTALKIENFLIHDWDLDDGDIDISLDKNDASSAYSSLTTEGRAQYTKNQNITVVANNNLHWNKRNLESVLEIKNKGTAEIGEKLGSLTTDQVMENFPKFLTGEIIQFIES